MKTTFIRHLLVILSILAITIHLDSCSDDYLYVNKVGNSSNDGNTVDNNDESEDIHENADNSDNEQIENDIFADLEDNSKEVHQEFTKDDLDKIDTNLEDLKIKIYANKNRNTFETRPIIIFTRGIFNDAYEQVISWIDNLYKNNIDIKNKTAFIVISNYKSPSTKYQYKETDTALSWKDASIHNFNDLHELATKYGQNVKYNNSNDGFINTIEDISLVMDKLIMSKLASWHMNVNNVATVALGSYTTTAVLYTVGTSGYKNKVTAINGFVPIIAFSQGKPHGVTDKGEPNTDYIRIKNVTGKDAASIKAFSNLRLSKYFFKSYIDSNANSDLLNRYNLLKIFPMNTFTQYLHFINANSDSGVSAKAITGQEFLLRDNVSSVECGIRAIAADVDYESSAFGIENGSYYNWPSNNAIMNNVLNTLVKNNIVGL